MGILHSSITIEGETASRVALTGPAAELLLRLWDRHGPLMFHQSGGCCDGSSPMCFPAGEFITGDSDVLLGRFDLTGGPGAGSGAGADSGADAGAGPKPLEFWMSKEQFNYWSHTHLTVDVVKGRGSGFSVEAPEGVRFLIRSRLVDGFHPA
jgi:hypothetical protein